MNAIWKLKEQIKKHSVARYVIEERKRRRYTRLAETMDDRAFIAALYTQRIGRQPDLDHPATFTEKLQWLKLNDRDPALVRASDKFEAKRYIAERGFASLLIPTLAVYDDVDQIDLNALPQAFIIKATHGSGWNLICRDKASFRLSKNKKIMRSWLRQNLYVYGREWNYQVQTPRLIVEPLMDTQPLVDYKFMCFHGVCKAMQVNHDRNGVHYVDYYDENWNLFADMSSGTADISGVPLPKPARFEEMKGIAEQLAAPFPFVRVDLYDIHGRIYFGEMTFFPGSGFWKITPEHYDRMFGDWLELPAVASIEK